MGATMDENDLALQRKAIESLIRDAALWKKKRDRADRATRLTQFSLNKNFLKNLLTRNESFNDRLKTAKESKLKRPQKDGVPSDNEPSTSKDASRKYNQDSSLAESEESYRVVHKKQKKRRKRRSSSESLTSDDSSTSSTSDSSIEVIIAKKRKRRKKEKSNKHCRKRRSPSSSTSYEALRKHIKKSFSSKYLKFPSQSKSKKFKRQLERSANIHKQLEDSDSEVSVKEISTNKDKILTSHQNVSDVTLSREVNESEKTGSNQLFSESQSKESIKKSTIGKSISKSGERKEEPNSDIVNHNINDECENEKRKKIWTPKAKEISCKQSSSVNKDPVIEKTGKFETIPHTILKEGIKNILKKSNKKMEKSETDMSKKIPKNKEYSDNLQPENKKGKSRHKSSRKKSGINRDKTLEKGHKLVESQEIEKEKMLPKKVNLYSDDEDVFLKIVPTTEKENILNRRLKDEFYKMSNVQDNGDEKTSHSSYKNEKEKENKSLTNEEKTNTLDPQVICTEKTKFMYDKETADSKNHSDLVKDIPSQDGVEANKIRETPSDKINTTPQEESIIVNKSDGSIDVSSKVSFSLSTKQIKTVNKPTEFQQHETETSDRSESPSQSVQQFKKSKKRSKKQKAKRRSSSSVKIVSPKVDTKKRKSRSRSKRSHSARDSSSRSVSRRKSVSRSISRYSRRGSRTRSSDSYSYTRSSRSKYRSYTRSRSRSSYRRYSRSSRDSRSYSRDSRKKYRHSSYSSRDRHTSRSSYRYSRSSSRHRSREYRDRSSSSRSRRRRSISFSCVYTNPEKARKYYRRSLSSSSSSSNHSYRKYKGK